MSFYRFRFANTLLLFIIGIVLGLIIKDRVFDKTENRPSVPAPYNDTASAKDSVGPGETKPAATLPAPQENKTTASNTGDEEEFVMPLDGKTEIRTEEEDEPGETEPAAKPEENKAGEIVKNAEEAFFKNPGKHLNNVLEMELQIIFAKKFSSGWRLNFVYTGPDKSVNYVYIDDKTFTVLGDKPDLKIGYYYRIRFLCGKGDLNEGNVLSDLSPTNNKASWATGVSALE